MSRTGGFLFHHTLVFQVARQLCSRGQKVQARIFFGGVLQVFFFFGNALVTEISECPGACD